MAYIFFTSDMHWSHHAILQYCKRPFRDVAHMLQVLVDKWNKRVSPDDTVCHLGDWCFTGRAGTGRKAHEYEAMLNGKIIHIKGNHDKNNSLRFALEQAIIRLANYNVFMQHRPPRNGNEIPKDTHFVICGHVHGAFKHAWIKSYGVDKMIINVGTDVWDYAPVRADELIGYYESVSRKETPDKRVYIQSFYEQKLI